jgi:hypothetical protein
MTSALGFPLPSRTSLSRTSTTLDLVSARLAPSDIPSVRPAASPCCLVLQKVDMPAVPASAIGATLRRKSLRVHLLRVAFIVGTS